ncbi:hypothetical protein N42HA_00916 [Lactococcus lactis]|nr:hypothetical protein [Lactococcus lactis]
MYSSLNNGSINALMDDEPVIKYALKQGQKFATPIKPIPDGQYGFAVKKGSNPELIEMFNNGLANLRANGEYDKIIVKYLAIVLTSIKCKRKYFLVFYKITGNKLAVVYSLRLTAILSFILAMIVGIIFGLFSVAPSKILRTIARIYVDLNRSIPLLVLTIFIFYGIPNLLQIITGHQIHT